MEKLSIKKVLLNKYIFSFVGNAILVIIYTNAYRFMSGVNLNIIEFMLKAKCINPIKEQLKNNTKKLKLSKQ